MMWTQQFWASAAQSVKGSMQKLVVSTGREYYYKFYFFFWNLPIRRRDLWWLALAPGYMMVDTLRHEISHAIVAWLTGVQVLAIHFLPGKQLGYFSFGYIILGDNASWLIYAAPYLCDLIVFSTTYFLVRSARFKRRGVVVNLVLLRRLYRLCIFHSKVQPPFWLAWAEGKKACRRNG